MLFALVITAAAAVAQPVPDPEPAAADAGSIDATAAPAIAPAAEPPATAVPDPHPAPAGPLAQAERHESDRSIVIIKLVLGFTVLLAVAYIGGHRRVVALEKRLGITGLITAGFPFVALGVIVRQPEVGILTTDVLSRIQPLLHFGLGWLGFIIGAQLDIRLLDRVPRGTAYLIVVEALVPFVVTAAACGALAQMLGLADFRDPDFWRDLILLGTAAAMTAPRRFRGFANRTWREGRSVDLLIGQLDEIVGVVGLLFIAAYFRPPGDTGWQLPVDTAWLFITIGLGVVVGVLIFTMVRVPKSSGEFLAVVLGSIAFGSGLAGYLYLSPIVVCFIAGALVNNFPCEQRDDIFRILNHLERPIHLLFLIVAGANWDVTALQPWLVVPAFVIARIIGKWIGVIAARSTVGLFMPASYTGDRLLVSALSPLSIALVLSVNGGAGGWILTVVIGGAILTEVAVQLTSPSTPAAPPPRPPRPDLATADEIDAALEPLHHEDDLPMRARPPTRRGTVE